MRPLLISLLLSAFAQATPAPQQTDGEVRAKLRARLGEQREILLRDVHRLGDGKIELELFAESEMDPQRARAILADFPRYGSWMLRDINRAPDGSRYLCQLQQLRTPPRTADLLEALYSFDVPLFHTQRLVTFRLKSEAARESFTVLAESEDPADALATADGVLKVFPSEKNPSRSWIYARGRVHLRSWLLYEALPEKVLSHETAERLRILLDNYLREESVRRTVRLNN